VIAHCHRNCLSRLLRTLVVCLVCVISIPGEVMASLDIAPGQSAVVGGTGGDPINLRAKPNADSQILATVSDGEVVDVIEGPMQDWTGLWWYKVVANGTRAYVAAEFLTVTGSSGGATGVVTGTATVTNTGGDEINCRAGAGPAYSVIWSFVAGNVVELTGERSGPWQPVNCGGQGGYVHTDFLSTGGDSEGGAEATATRATIVNTGGDPINCRAGAGLDAQVLTIVYAGERVSLRGNLTGNWQPVTCGGVSGFIEKSFLSTTNSDGDRDNDGGSADGTGIVANTNGDGLNCRRAASFDGAVITVLGEGTKLKLRGSAANGWQPVVCAGKNGFVSAEYIEIDDSGSVPDPDPAPEPTSDFDPGNSVVVANTNGEGLRLRSRADSSSSIITVLPEGERLVVRRGSSGDWVAVTYRTSNGFVHKDYLAKVSSETPTPAPDDGGLRRNDHARLTDVMNFRSEPSFSGAITTTLPKGTVVLITGPADNGFYPVTTEGFSGYLHGDYLVRTDEPLTGDGDDGVGGDPGDGPATPQGTKMITYAMKFLGYPYVWATHGPDTFDCSGFTYYVTLKTLKTDIGAGTWSQSVTGTPVSYGDLRPGDLIFFQNTFTWGLSHVGIYIGNGKFIHAENETTGVVVSSLTSTYYKTRWYGARRVTTD
jgi:uncharacterized protein YgiM (DUF1202 family)